MALRVSCQALCAQCGGYRKPTTREPPDTVKWGCGDADTKRVTSDHPSTLLPAYLAGLLLARGRTRLIWTTVTILAGLIAGSVVQTVLGHQSVVIVAPALLTLAWMWGSIPGTVVGVAGTVGNAVWAREAGLVTNGWGTTAAEVVVVGVVAFLVGHAAHVLEKALGARDQATRAFDELEAVARDRMLSIADEVPIGLFRTTPDGRIIGGNEALMNILGFSDEQSMLETNVWDHYVDAHERESVLQRLTQGGPSWTEFRLRKRDGSVIWVRDWAVGVTGEDGQVMYFDGVLEDITERRLADERFRAAFEDSPNGMSLSTAAGYVVRGNAALADMLQLPLDELTDIHFSQFTFPDEIEVTAAALERVGTGKVVRYEKRLRRTDGTFFWALITLAPIRDGSDPQLFISHVIDVTARRRVREGLEHLVRSKDELIASVSHELRTPLTVIHGLAQELDTSWISFSVPEQKEFIAMIAQQSSDVANIVEDLLVAARADIGKLPIHPTTIDLRSEIDAALASVPEMKVGLSLVGDAAPIAFADPTRVRQVVRNLFANAKRYGGPETKVHYGCERNRAWVEVTDNGPGVPAEEVDKIFEPYERAHNAAGQPMSVGLGLTISRKLAEMMGGRLEYRFANGWSTFRLELPVPGTVQTGR